MTSYIACSVATTYGIAYALGNFISQYYYCNRNHHQKIPFDQLAINCELSLLSYSDPQTLNKIVSDKRDIFPKECHFLEDKECDCQAYIWNIKDKIYLIFRGTEDIRDILANIDVRTEEIKINDITVNIHYGFHKQFFSLERKITEFIENSKTLGINEMIITGHSLGGSLASIANFYYSKVYPEMKITTYTYGSPRVGDEIFSNDKCHENGYRVFNYYDPVPMVPITSRFYHVCATPICINDSSPFYNPIITYEIASREDINTFLRPFMLFRFTPLSSQYHRINKYKDILWSILKS